MRLVISVAVFIIIYLVFVFGFFLLASVRDVSSTAELLFEVRIYWKFPQNSSFQTLVTTHKSFSESVFVL